MVSEISGGSHMLNITSEIGKLKRVILHSLGKEVESMSPSTAEEALYNDIIPFYIVKKEHDELRSFLSTVAHVYEIQTLLAETLRDKTARDEFVSILCNFYHIQHRIPELQEKTAEELAHIAIEGLPAVHTKLSSFINHRRYDIRPLPNMYFMRDASIVYRNGFIASAMKYPVRLPEVLINRFVFTHHPDFSAAPCILDGPGFANESFSIEGGDVQILGKNILAIGISERTSADAVDMLAKKIVALWKEPIKIFAVLLPIERAMIHLDMVFTMIDVDACLAYEPVMLSRHRARVIRIDVSAQGTTHYTEETSLLAGLKKAGIDLEPIHAGGDNNIQAEREQWLSGANSFSFGPGKILKYSCNMHTAEALAQHGFEIKHARDIMNQNIDPFSYKKLAVLFDGIELARGGGGARCMTCPVEREDI